MPDVKVKAGWAAVPTVLLALSLVTACGQQPAAGSRGRSPSATPTAPTSGAYVGYADPLDEQVLSFAAGYQIQRSGTVHVIEHIAYDFRQQYQPGIFRELNLKEAYGQTPHRGVTYRVRNVRATSTDASSQLKLMVTEANSILQIRIGDPDSILTGLHHYTLQYDLDGVLTTAGGRPQLSWDVIGDRWSNPMAAAHITVKAPGGVSTVSCRPRWSAVDAIPASPSAPDDITPCAAAVSANMAVVTQRRIAPHARLIVVAGLKPGAAAVPSR